MSVAMEKFMHTLPNPIESWGEVEQNKRETVLKKAPWLKKAWALFTLSLITALSLSSCGWDKSVDAEVSDIIKDRQEQVDKLSKKEAKLQKELNKIRLEKNDATEELKKAEKLKK